MYLRLTPDMLEAAYDYLRVSPPFNKWGFPAGETVGFHVSRSKKVMGSYTYEEADPQTHWIEISEVFVATSHTLLQIMAHEMIHMHQKIKGLKRGGEHNADFNRRAKRVCRYHGFDQNAFFC